MAYCLALGCGRDEFLTEVIPARVFTGLLNYNLFEVVRQLEDDEFQLLPNFKLIEF
jgi:hypothetical protein